MSYVYQIVLLNVKMDTLILNLFISAIVFIFPYLIKFRKKYHLIAGFSDLKNKGEEIDSSLKKTAIQISNSAFLFCALIVLLSILNYMFSWEEYLNSTFRDFMGGIIIVCSGIFSTLYYLITKYL